MRILSQHYTVDGWLIAAFLAVGLIVGIELSAIVIYIRMWS